MTTNSSSERLLKTICGSCLILAPAVLLVGGAIHPEETTDAARQYEIIADNLGRWELAHWLIAGSMLLMMGAGDIGHAAQQIAANGFAGESK